MKIFFVETSLGMVERLYVPNGVKNILISYWYVKDVEQYKKFKKDHPDIKIMLDSGAFSARTKDKNIPVKEYTEFCNQVFPYVDYIMNLDVISSAKKSKENYDYMRNANIPKLIPIYHTTEPMSYLEYYNKMADYIAIGIYREIKPHRRTFWNYIANILSMIPKNKKIHLLGVNSPQLLYLFADRITSVDSTSMSKMSGDMNRVFNATGMPITTIGFMKKRLTIPERFFLRKYNLLREIRLEKEINDYVNGIR